ncbi:MAG: hypothetical protein U1E48_14015 [Paracoccaceae bacterium]
MMAGPAMPPFAGPADDIEGNNLGDLVASAQARVRRQAAYMALAAKGGAKAAAIHDWLEQAATCVTTLARPRIVRQPLSAVARPDGILIAGGIHVVDPSLSAPVAGGGRLDALLCTLGYGQEAAFDWLGRDYGLHHVQTDVARETLFALARAADRACLHRLPGWRLRRIPVRTHVACSRQHLWEPAQVQALLAAFDQGDPGVGLTTTGFFQPLHSLLSLTLLQPPARPEGLADQGRLS